MAFLRSIRNCRWSFAVADVEDLTAASDEVGGSERDDAVKQFAARVPQAMTVSKENEER